MASSLLEPSAHTHAIGCWAASNAAFWSVSILCYVLDRVVPRSSPLGRWLFLRKVRPVRSTTSGLVMFFRDLCQRGQDSERLVITSQKWLINQVQAEKSYLTGREYFEATRLSALNMGPVALLASLPFTTLRASGVLGTPLAAADAWRAPRELLILLVIAPLVVDIWFYATHRALHFPRLYATIHKIHHRFKAPAAVCAVCVLLASSSSRGFSSAPAHGVARTPRPRPRGVTSSTRATRRRGVLWWFGATKRRAVSF